MRPDSRDKTLEALLLLAVVVCPLACRRPVLLGVDEDLRADVSRLDFGDTWLRARSRRPLTLTNAGGASVAVTFTAPSPFGAPPAVELASGQSLTLEPTFRPDTLGPASGALTVQTGRGTLSLDLSGNGVEAPPCDATACREATLDGDTGVCVQTPKPDGEPCDDSCLVGATCVGGTCTGATRDCADPDPCTTDACAAGAGCVHAPVECQTTDPCSVASCDPASGCVTHSAPDGSRCGDADCVTAHVCMAGQCVTRAVPDGAVCGATSVCQAPGQCQARACVQPPATPVARVWRYQPSSGGQLVGLVGDGQNGLFTVECRTAGWFSAQCQAISFSASGVERWRAPFSHTTYTGAGALRDSLMLAGERLVSTVGPDWVDVFDTSTGAPAWALDLRTQNLFPQGSSPVVRFTSVAFDGGDELVLALEGSNGGAISGNAVVGLAAASGALRRQLQLPAQGFSLLLDRRARIYVAHMSGTTTLLDTVTALEGSFAVRWQHTSPVSNSSVRSMQATHRGALYLGHATHSELLSTASGATLTSALPASPLSGKVAWSDSALYAERLFCPAATCSSYVDYVLELAAINPSTLQAPAITLSPASCVAAPWVTARGTSVVALQPAVLGAVPELREVDSGGRLVMRCPLELDRGRDLTAGPVLGDGRYAAIVGQSGYPGNERLEVWDLPGYAPGTSGWVSPRGGPGLDLREQ